MEAINQYSDSGSGSDISDEFDQALLDKCSMLE
jgi:hypothetical protein